MVYAVVVRNVAFVPAAFVPQFNYGKKHVFNGGRIILHGKTFVPVGIDSLGQHTDCRRCSFTHRRINDAFEFSKNFLVINCNEGCGLPVAARRCTDAGLNYFNQVTSGNRNILVLSSVTVP